jgi:hypothetical protein
MSLQFEFKINETHFEKKSLLFFNNSGLMREIDVIYNGFYEIVLTEQQMDFLCIILFVHIQNSNKRTCKRIVGSSCILNDHAKKICMHKTNYYDTRDVENIAEIHFLKSALDFNPNFKVPRVNFRINSLQKKFKACNEFVEKVKMPYYYHEFTQSLLPGSVFFAIPQEARVSEKIWISQFSKILDRASIRLPNIQNKSIEQIPSDFSPLHWIADAITDVVNRYPYICDIQESFDDIFLCQSGDCEDYAKGMMRVFLELKNSAQKANSVFLKSVYKTIKDYEPYAVLGSVLSQSYEKHIHSKNLKNQAHMFCILMNNTKTHAITLEGTAALSYTIRETPPLKLPAQFYQIYKFTDHDFYQRIVFLYDKFGNSFLITDQKLQIYGVKYSEFMKNPSIFGMQKDFEIEKHPNVNSFVRNILFKMQAPINLPIEINYNKVIACEVSHSTSTLVLIEKKNLSKSKIIEIYKQKKVLKFIEENKNYFRFQI